MKLNVQYSPWLPGRNVYLYLKFNGSFDKQLIISIISAHDQHSGPFLSCSWISFFTEKTEWWYLCSPYITGSCLGFLLCPYWIKPPLHGFVSFFSVYSASNLLVLFNDSILRKGLRCALPVVSTASQFSRTLGLHPQVNKPQLRRCLWGGTNTDGVYTSQWTETEKSGLFCRFGFL